MSPMTGWLRTDNCQTSSRYSRKTVSHQVVYNIDLLRTALAQMFIQQQQMLWMLIMVTFVNCFIPDSAAIDSTSIPDKI